jgi:predicted nucleic acid-binding protein
MEILSPTYCLDACAVIAYLRAESGADILQGIIAQPRRLLAMHICNLGEVYYDFLRADGAEAAQAAWASTLDLPLELRRDVDDTFIKRVGTFKVEERVSFADAFALALTERLQVPLVTTDHHEFDPIERKGHLQFLWLR